LVKFTLDKEASLTLAAKGFLEFFNQHRFTNASIACNHHHFARAG
jgi:hypothetical protein